MNLNTPSITSITLKSNKEQLLYLRATALITSSPNMPQILQIPKLQIDTPTAQQILQIPAPTRRYWGVFREIIIQLRAVPPLGPTLDLIELLRRGPLYTPNYPETTDPLKELKTIFLYSTIYPLIHSKTFTKLWTSLTQLPQFPPNPKENPYPLALKDQATAYLIAQLWETESNLLPKTFPPPPPQIVLHKLSDISSTDENSKEVQFLREKESNIKKILTSINIKYYIKISNTLQNIIENFSELKSPYTRFLWKNWHSKTERFKTTDNTQKLYLPPGKNQTELTSTNATHPLGGYTGLSKRGRWEHINSSSLLLLTEDPDIFLAQYLSDNLLFFQPENNSSFTHQKELFAGISIPPQLFILPPHDTNCSTASHSVAFLASLLEDLGGILSQSISKIIIAFPKFELWKDIYPTLKLFFRNLPKIGAKIKFEMSDPSEIKKQYEKKDRYFFKILLYSETEKQRTEITPTVSIKFENKISTRQNKTFQSKPCDITKDNLTEFLSNIRTEVLKQFVPKSQRSGASRYV